MQPQALQIIMYHDDVEVCNPLGSYRGVHKLGKSALQLVILSTI